MGLPHIPHRRMPCTQQGHRGTAYWVLRLKSYQIQLNSDLMNMMTLDPTDVSRIIGRPMPLHEVRVGGRFAKTKNASNKCSRSLSVRKKHNSLRLMQKDQSETTNSTKRVSAARRLATRTRRHDRSRAALLQGEGAGSGSRRRQGRSRAAA